MPRRRSAIASSRCAAGSPGARWPSRCSTAWSSGASVASPSRHRPRRSTSGLRMASVPAPKGYPAAPLRALIIDSWFDNYVGVVMLVRVMEGTLKPKDRVLLMSTEATHLCEHVGVFTPKAKQKDQLAAGEVGYVTAGVKGLREAKVGDTITHADKPAAQPLPGFKEVKPQVFAGLYPVEANEYEALREALEKL